MCSSGPLAHRLEKGTFNPKVLGSRPRRPTLKAKVTLLTLMLLGTSSASEAAESPRVVPSWALLVTGAALGAGLAMVVAVVAASRRGRKAV